MSLPLIVLVPTGLRLAGAGGLEPWIASGIFQVQCIATALSPRRNGVRSICNFLAVHSTRKVAVTSAGAGR